MESPIIEESELPLFIIIKRGNSDSSIIGDSILLLLEP